MDEKDALAMDEKDPLKEFRNRFYLRPGEIYMDGNSLGLLSKDAEKSVIQVIDEWKTLGIGGWLEGDPPWFSYAESLSFHLSPLLGAGTFRHSKNAC